MEGKSMRTHFKTVVVFFISIFFVVGMSSCFKKNKAQESKLSEIKIQAPQVEGITFKKVKLTATATTNSSNSNKNCQEARVPEAGNWRNFSGEVPYAQVSLTLGCEYDFDIGFEGEKGDKSKKITYAGQTTQTIKKNADGKALVSIKIKPVSDSASDSDSVTVTGDSVADNSQSDSSSSSKSLSKEIKVKNVQIKKK